MLQPPMIRPSSVSSAAPTLKLEYCACARVRASAATVTSTSSWLTYAAAVAWIDTGCQPRSLRRSVPERRCRTRRSDAGAAARSRRRSFPVRRSPLRGAGWPRRGAGLARSESLNDGLQECREFSADPACDFHHLVVDERLGKDTGCRVRDARDAEDLHSHVPRH